KMKPTKTTIPLIRNSVNRSPLRLAFLFIPLVFACFALSPAPKAFGVSPPPDGGYANANTAEGINALFSLTSGFGNTANGFEALFSNTTGNANTANGSAALLKNTTGIQNTATGDGALQSNTTGTANTATSNGALVSNTTGKLNTAVGDFAGQNLTTGNNNIDVGNPGALAAESNIIRIGTVVAFTDKANFMHPAHTDTFIAGIHGVAVTGSAVTVNS